MQGQVTPEPSTAPGTPALQVSSGKDGKGFEPDMGSALSELNPGFLMAI